ncbi:MAG: helix-turn-helix domain-containing protein [Candidatus Thiodiazotropha taylori]
MNEPVKWSELDDEENLTVDQLAAYLNVSKSHLDKARMTPGKGPVYWKSGRNVRYQVGNVREWMEEQKRSSTRLGFSVSFNSGADDLPSADEIEEWLS